MNTKKKAQKKKSLDLTAQAHTFVGLVMTAFKTVKQNIKTVYRGMVQAQLKHTYSASIAGASDDQVNKAKRLVNKIIYAQGESEGINVDSLRVYCSLASKENKFPADVVNKTNASKRKAKDKKVEDIQGVVMIDTRLEDYSSEIEKGIASLLSMFVPKAHIDEVIESINNGISRTKFKNKIELRKVA